jgi:sterol desaturase/sphingolipid hydroxylase (fatty acid hydroxylase superfamily)
MSWIDQTWRSSLGVEVDWKQVLLIGMSPVFLLAFAIEWQVMRGRGRREPFAWRDIVANLKLGGAYQLFELVAHVTFTAAAVAWFWRHRLFDAPVNGWTILPIFIGVEFCYYWFHRTSHRVRWFWSAHVVHHSSEHMNMTTAMRQSLLYSITGWWLFFMPLVLLGVAPAVVFFLYAVNLSYQYFVHTESVGTLPRWVETIFDTPSNHRVHHGRNPQYIDRNYGGVLIVFDRWFGTYVEEQEKVEYGIATRQPHSYQLLVLNFHEFLDLWRDVLHPGPLWLRLKHLWAPPEWQRPADLGSPAGEAARAAVR